MRGASADCLTENVLDAFVSGDADAATVAHVESHVAHCSTCGAILRALVAARGSRASRAALEMSSTLPAGWVGEDAALLERGARLGRYEILSCLGAGAMGVVYAALDPALDRRVAIKLLRRESGAQDGELGSRLVREGKAMARLSHPNVVTVYDVGDLAGRVFVAMELIDGHTLRQWLREAARTADEILDAFMAAGRGLAAAHEAGLVHRDFKPDNVLVRKDGRVCVTDFGLARLHGAASGEASSRAAGDARSAPADIALTQTGALIGTPAYMAPEQLAGVAADARSDVFAFCVALYEALYERRPFAGATIAELHRNVRAEALVPHEEPSRVPAEVRAALLEGLRPDPLARPQTIAGLLSLVEAARARRALLALTEVAAPPQSSPDSGEVARPGERGSWRARGIALAVALLALGATASGLFVRARARATPFAQTRPDPAAVLAAPDVRVACPIFDARGVVDIAGPLGAAAASLACERVKWYLGGRDDRILPAAALLDVPVQPIDGFADPYSGPDVRARTLDLARARAGAYLDGAVTRGPEGWHVVASLRASDDREIRRAEGEDAKELAVAVKRALTLLWSARPLVPRAIDPEVARWTSFPDIEVGLAATDLLQVRHVNEACETLHRRAGELGKAFYQFAVACHEDRSAVVADAGAPVLDESSAPALAITGRAIFEWGAPISKEETRRVAAELDEMRAREPLRFGRALLADVAGRLWVTVNEAERAHEALLAAIREDPLVVEAWQELAYTSTAVGSTSAVASVAAAWFPTQAAFLPDLTSARAEDLPARLREARLASVFEPNSTHALQLGRALAELGRATEAREVAAVSVGDAAADQQIQSYVRMIIDLHDARMDRASKQLLEFMGLGGIDLVTVAAVLGRTEDVGTQWATSFLASPDDRANRAVIGRVASAVLCMHARRELAVRCVERVATLAHASRNWWGEGGEVLLEGAKRYARGDVRGAVATWRPLVAGPTFDIVRLLPTEAFERAGEPDLAARLDARKMSVTIIAGVSEAAPREAKRAFAAGDRARAKELAQKVVSAWEVADATVPAVAEMRALLRAIER